MTERQRPKRGTKRAADKTNEQSVREQTTAAADTPAAEDTAAVPASASAGEATAPAEKKPRARSSRKRSSHPPKSDAAPTAAKAALPPAPPVPAIDLEADHADVVAPAASPEPIPDPASSAADIPEAPAPVRGAVEPDDAPSRATVAPPSRRTPANGRPQGAGAVTSVNGSDVRGDLPPDDEIWTDGASVDEPRAVAREAADSREPAARLVRGSTGDRLHEAAAFGSAQSLLSTDYYFRQYGAHGMRSLVAEIDDMGFDPHVDAKVRPLLETLCKRYFRVALAGAEHLPENGRALLVANRSGALPWDGLVLRTALRAARPSLCPLRWLAEDSVIHYPFMGVMMNRLGAVRACPENAERLLSQDRMVAVFPEGAQGSRKLFRDRYRLQRFGRGGYVKLALKFGVPILPTAIIGAEETNPVLGRSRLLGRIVGTESMPITPTFPWLGPLGLLPAPIKWRIAIGEPIDLSKHGPRSADDALVVHRLNEQIRASLQTLVDQSKTARGRALFG